MLLTSTSVRLFIPLTRVVIFGDIAAPPMAAIPPSMVVVCTIVTSALTAAEHTATTIAVVAHRAALRADNRASGVRPCTCGFIETSICRNRRIVSPAGDAQQNRE